MTTQTFIVFFGLALTFEIFDAQSQRSKFATTTRRLNNTEHKETYSFPTEFPTDEYTERSR